MQQVSRPSLDDCLHPAGTAPHHHRFRDRRAGMRNSVPVIASNIVLALLVAAVGGGVPILERRLSLRSLLNISADSPLFGSVGSVASLAGSAISRCSHPRVPANPGLGGRAAPSQAVHPHSRLLCLPLSGAAILPAMPERPRLSARQAAPLHWHAFYRARHLRVDGPSESAVHCIRAAGLQQDFKSQTLGKSTTQLARAGTSFGRP